MESFKHVYEIKSGTGRFAITVVIIAVCLFIFLISSGNDGELSEGDILNRAPALALTDAELALADTILDNEQIRNALSYDIAENTTAFSLDDVQEIIAPVIPADAEVTQVSVSGAVVIIDYRQPQHRIILEYVDADRSGTVDQVCKTLMPHIDGVSTGRYRVSHNLTTGKIVYTYTSN